MARKGLFGAIEKLAGIFAVEDGDAGALNKIIVGAVVNQDNSFGSENRRRAGLDDAGIEFSRAGREHGISVASVQ